MSTSRERESSYQSNLHLERLSLDDVTLLADAIPSMMALTAITFKNCSLGDDMVKVSR